MMHIKATQREATLVRHLMMYAGLSMARDEVIDVNAILSEIVNKSEVIRVGQGAVSAHFRLSRIRALASTSSLRMTAVIATFAGFPASQSVW